MITSFFKTALVMVTIDFMYLFSVKSYFENQIKKVQKFPLKINVFATFCCYLFLVLGLNYFIIIQKKTPIEAFFLGIFVYGVYETTNWSLFSNWSYKTVIMDTIWGGILFYLTTSVVQHLGP